MSRPAVRMFILSSWLVLGIRETASQTYKCPLGWVTFNDHCYHFVFYPTQTYNMAAAVCEQDGAYLVSVNSEAEHLFVSQWLTSGELDRSRRWWTSGIGAGSTLRWEGDGTTTAVDLSNKWAETGADQTASQHIVYAFTIAANTFLWARKFDNEASPYICEISREETFRIMQSQRDFSYGTPYSDPTYVPRGPRFTILPESVVVSDRVESTYLECEADSDPPPSYTWYKETNASAVEITTEKNQRYSLINGRLSLQSPQASEDAGLYFCVAQNDFGSIRSQSVRVSFGFLREFSNVAPGAVRAKVYQGTVINCNPPGYSPDASFQWFKGPGPNFLRTDLNKYQFVSYNGRLYLSETQLSDAGVYHCVVTLTAPLGQRFATAQPPSRTSLGTELIVQGDAFAPTFSKRPVADTQTSSLGANATIICQPEASPAPVITWSHNDISMNLVRGAEGRVMLLDNGNLLITEVQLSDQGRYTCTAENINGKAESSGLLSVVSRTTITAPPSDTRVDVNGTAFLRCQASFDRKQRDLAYTWSFNSAPVHVDKDPTFKWSPDTSQAGLYIINTQFQHDGVYTCTALTVDEAVTASAYLTVYGPPSEPAGVYGEVTGLSVVLTWTVGDSHGADILFFNIEFSTNFNPEWRYKHTQINNAQTMSSEHPDKRTYVINDLSPGSAYSFRVSAINRYGVGAPSQPSAFFKIPDAPPKKAPEHISSIVQPVGMLAFTWTPLNEEDLTGEDVGYQAFWRRKMDRDDGSLWQSATINGRTNTYSALVGQDNYYLEYEVKVGAFNSRGKGPNSTVFIIMSSEDLPITTPRNVRTQEHNATSFWAFWDKIDSSRQAARGKVIGFQVNYWLASDPGTIYSSNVWCEDCQEHLVIGVLPNQDYWLNVQVFNSIGLGPKGEDTFVSLLLNAPLLYPEYVMVASRSSDSVFVQWRGVTIGLLEEPLIGYILRWWPATENIRTANNTAVYKRQTWGVVAGIKEGVVYALRVLAFNRGGEGKKSPTVYFTLEGMVLYNPETTEILAGACQSTFSIWTIVVAYFTAWLFFQEDGL